MTDIPEWLTELRRLRFQSGAPSSRNLALQIDRSHTHIARIFQGHRPKNRTIINDLLAAMTSDEETITRIQKLFDNDESDYHPPPQTTFQPSPTVTTEAATDRLADAINNLADAIRHFKEQP